MAKYNVDKNRYQYETSPKKLQPEYQPIKRKQSQKNHARKKEVAINTKKKNNLKIVLYIGIVFAMLFVISYRNSLIAQEYSKIKSLKSDLSSLEKENKQLEVNIESKTNLGAIEEKASKELGLKKLDDSQIVYVNLEKQDYVEPSVDEVEMPEEENWFQNLINKIKSIF